MAGANSLFTYLLMGGGGLSALGAWLMTRPVSPLDRLIPKEDHGPWLDRAKTAWRYYAASKGRISKVPTALKIPLRASLAAMFAAGGLLAFPSPMTVLGAGSLGWFLLDFVERYAEVRLRAQVAEQMLSLAQNVKAQFRGGTSFPNALKRSLPGLLQPMRQELEIVVKDFDGGVPLPVAFEAAGYRHDNKDFLLLAENADAADENAEGARAALKSLINRLRATEKLKRERKISIAGDASLMPLFILMWPAFLAYARFGAYPQLWQYLGQTIWGQAFSLLGNVLDGVALVTFMRITSSGDIDKTQLTSRRKRMAAEGG